MALAVNVQTSGMFNSKNPFFALMRMAFLFTLPPPFFRSEEDGTVFCAAALIIKVEPACFGEEVISMPPALAGVEQQEQNRQKNKKDPFIHWCKGIDKY